MSLNNARRTSSKRETLSSMVDQFFDRYTVVPSSVTGEEEIDELRVSLENLGAEIPATDGANIVTASQKGTIDPRQTQLPSSSAEVDTGSYARKTIPQTILETMPQVPGSPSSSTDVVIPSPITVDSDSDSTLEGQTSCEQCLNANIDCIPNPQGMACTNCKSKKKKCSFVTPPKPKPGARGINTPPPDESFDSFNSERYAITDSNDESFEMDSYRVTLQRVFGRVSYLTKTQEDRFADIEAHLEQIDRKQDLILERLNNGN